MIWKDHVAVGDYLLAKMDTEMSEHEKQAFLFGCIEPDFNPLTYLRGSIRNQTFRGHNYENAHAYIRLLIYRLEQEEIGGMHRYYLLGKLLHYVADAFTFPHNQAFPGTLREHCQYEKILHEYMLDTLERKWQKHAACEQSGKLMKQIEQMHEAYEIEDAGYETDCTYILRAVALVWLYFTEPAVYGLREQIA